MGTVQEDGWGRDFKGKKAGALKREKWRVKSEEFNSPDYLKKKGKRKREKGKREKGKSKFENSTSAESRQFNIQNSKINIPIAGLSLSFILWNI